MKVAQSSITFQADQPAFIVFEGVNGAGKSTLLKKCNDYLTTGGRTVLTTREPGDGEFGQKVREIVLGQDEANKLHPLTELFLFAADRTEHVVRTIQPALATSQVVLCDRYYYSTEAFQGYGRELCLNTVRSINQTAIQGLRADLVVLIDLDPLEGLRRTRSRQDPNGAADADSFENEDLDFHHRLRDGFLEIAENTTEPFLVLDGTLSSENLFAELEPVLATLTKV